MYRALHAQALNKKKGETTALLLDGYVDEPASLGVPPYVSPQARYAYGALRAAGAEARYITIDQLRSGTAIPEADLLVALMGAVVPGKYLRGMPASARELCEIARIRRWVTVIGGAGVKFGQSDEIQSHFQHIARSDLDAYIFDFMKNGEARNRARTPEEWRDWSVSGAEAVRHHPDFPEPLIAELDTSRGCVRYFAGGCGFCIEPSHGKPYFRPPEEVAGEVKALHAQGVVNFRLGGQACIYSYMAGGVGKTETPRPNVKALKALLAGVRRAAPNLKVLHLDNANPAVIAEHPEEAAEATRIMVGHCTSGNVVAFGMESADPAVIVANNLNATPEQVLAAVRIVNEAGTERGENGLPKLLPGINILAGLDGETARTFDLNYRFLKGVLDEGLLLRRINVRQVAPTVREFATGDRNYGAFRRFKERVRTEIDAPMLARVAPSGGVLRDVYMEVQIGGCAYGRQIGSYPILVSFPYRAGLNRFSDALVVGHGPRSVTAVETPLDVNHAPMGALEALPGIGRKRAVRLARRRPFKDIDEMKAALDDPSIVQSLMKHLRFQ
ncbi:MAG: radical SAM protein [Euryarchaeota archaeon]|nr:radical SAM protein [Euryarchaeota archaeon]